MRTSALIGCVLLIALGLPLTAAHAQPATNTLQVVYWSTSATVSFTGVASSGSWSVPMYGLDYRLELPSRWGVHLNVLTGSESNWRGTILGVPVIFVGQSGTDTIWSADLSYRWDVPGLTPGSMGAVRLFAGWGGQNISSTFSPLSSNGVRVGVDGTFPFAAGWSLNANVAYEPSNSTSNVFGSGTNATMTGWDYSASLRYATPDGWTFEGGYRWVQENLGTLVAVGVNFCPCSQQWSGAFFQVGKTF